MPRNIFAYTPPGTMPAYVSLNEQNGTIVLHVRSSVQHGGDTACIDIPLDQLQLFCDALTKECYH